MGGMNRWTYRYRSNKDPGTELRMRIREIAQARVRYGYRKILALLHREGWKVGRYLVYRFYQEEGLTLRQRLRRRDGWPSTGVSGGSRRGQTKYGVWISWRTSWLTDDGSEP